MEIKTTIYTDESGRVFSYQNEANTLVMHEVAELPEIPEKSLCDGYHIYIDNMLSFGYEVNENKCYSEINNLKVRFKDQDQSWIPKHPILLDFAKAYKIIEIIEADKASDVFLIQDKRFWLGKTNRVVLASLTIPALAAAAIKTYSFINDLGEVVEVLLEPALYCLSELEIYAQKTWNLAAMNKNKVDNCKTVDEVNALDVTSNYPDILEFNL